MCGSCRGRIRPACEEEDRVRNRPSAGRPDNAPVGSDVAQERELLPPDRQDTIDGLSAARPPAPPRSPPEQQQNRPRMRDRGGRGVSAPGELRRRSGDGQGPGRREQADGHGHGHREGHGHRHHGDHRDRHRDGPGRRASGRPPAVSETHHPAAGTPAATSDRSAFRHLPGGERRRVRPVPAWGRSRVRWYTDRDHDGLVCET
jgi:hypothetical protein